MSIILSRSDKNSWKFWTWGLETLYRFCRCAGLPSIYCKSKVGIGCGDWLYSTSVYNLLTDLIQKFVCHGISTMFTKYYTKSSLFFTLRWEMLMMSSKKYWLIKCIQLHHGNICCYAMYINHAKLPTISWYTRPVHSCVGPGHNWSVCPFSWILILMMRFRMPNGDMISSQNICNFLKFFCLS